MSGKINLNSIELEGIERDLYTLVDGTSSAAARILPSCWIR